MSDNIQPIIGYNEKEHDIKTLPKWAQALITGLFLQHDHLLILCKEQKERISELETQRWVLLGALGQFVTADNSDYSCQAMRNLGYFVQARAAMEAVTGQSWQRADESTGNEVNPLVGLLRRVVDVYERGCPWDTWDTLPGALAPVVLDIRKLLDGGVANA